jgi:hypothetical protein
MNPDPRPNAASSTPIGVPQPWVLGLRSGRRGLALVSALAVCLVLVAVEQPELPVFPASAPCCSPSTAVTQTWLVSVGLLRLVFPAIGLQTQPELVAHAVGLASAALTSFWGHRAFSFASVRRPHENA